MHNGSTLVKRIQCPECKENGRDRSEDNLAIYDDGHGFCYSCNYFQPANKDTFEDVTYTYEYLPHRGLYKRTLEFFDIKTKVDADGQPISVGFRYPNSSYKVRSLADKAFRWEGTSEPGLFGRNLFSTGSSKAITITEGEYDAASLYQVLGSPVVSVRSSSSAIADVSHDRSWLAGFEQIYLAFDADTAGKDAVARVARLFDYNKVLVVNFDRRKDANEYLQAGEDQELRSLWWNAKKYLPETIVSSFSDFQRLLSETPKAGVPYPFPSLNQFTYGIRKGESVLITAQEGVGKTEIMHSILYNTLKETDDAIGAIFLEEPKGHFLRSIAGLHLKKPTHLPECGCTELEVMEAIKDCVRVDDRLHVYSHFGSDDPDVLLDTIRFQVSARGVAYLFLDHISMVVSGLAGEDERRALDYISTRLEMMVKELNFALIFVSHVNDNGQTRGSRYISKIADIRIDATRDMLHPDERIRNTTSLVVPKNRFCGKTGFVGNFIFDPYTRQFSEQLEAANDNFIPIADKAA